MALMVVCGRTVEQVVACWRAWLNAPTAKRRSSSATPRASSRPTTSSLLALTLRVSVCVCGTHLSRAWRSHSLQLHCLRVELTDVACPAVKTLEWDDENTINLQLWDVAGHERFGTMTRVYYKYAIAAVIVFDLQRHATFEAVLKWREDVNNKVVLANDEPIPCILLANKCDLEPVFDFVLFVVVVLLFLLLIYNNHIFHWFIL